MGDKVTFTIDGKEIESSPDRTILEAAEEHGIYIPRLCHMKWLEPYGGCRVCTVLVNGRSQSSCTQPVAQGISVENDTDQINEWRKSVVEMLFVEGNHFCMFCEKSGNCELQAVAYRLGIAAPRFDYMWPERRVDASHPDILIDHNRCIRCARCVRASRDLDGKTVFGFVGRGPQRELAVNAEARLVDTDLDATDEAVDVCPVGAILHKRSAYRTPIGQRDYDNEPIGSGVEHPVQLTVGKGDKR